MRSKLSILLLVLSLGTSCNQKIEPVPTVQDGIGFSTQVQTKSVSTTTASIREFTCFGYTQGNKLWRDVETTATSDLMWDNKYTGNGNSWAGETAIEWPVDPLTEYYAFFAYSPAQTIDNQIELLTNKTGNGYQQLRYETLTDVDNQIDLIVASRTNQHRINFVPLAFVHTLTRVGFAAFSNIAGTKINSISIKGVKYKGELPIHRDAVWENISIDKADFKVEMVPALSVSSDELKPTDLSIITRYCFNLLPQNLTSNTNKTTCISISYNQAGVEYTKEYTIVENLAKGQFTVYKINLNGTPNSNLQVSEVIITNWVLDGQEDMNTNDGAQQYEVFTASYSANGGGAVPGSEQIAANKKLTIGAAPISTPSGDHLFAGYNTNADGSGTSYRPGDRISLSANLTLYATWDLNYVLINDLKWAKGNLIANGIGKAKIGAPTDGGLYFQFGSLLGWKGGATGNGVGRSALGNATFYGGSTFNANTEIGVYPTAFTQLGSIGSTWPLQTTNLYYFGINTIFSSNYDLKDFVGYLAGNLASNGIGDACRHYMGNSWRMPTTQEIEELYNTANNIERTGSWVISSVDPNLVLSYTGNVNLTLPIVGCREGDGKLNNNGGNCYYSSSSVYDGVSRYYLFGGNSELSPKANYLRHTAMPVRCVKDL